MLRHPFAQAPQRQAIAPDRPGARVLPKRLPMHQRPPSASAPVPVPPLAPRVLLAHGREWRSRSRELERALRPAGYTVLEAFTGPDALQQAHRSQPDEIGRASCREGEWGAAAAGSLRGEADRSVGYVVCSRDMQTRG